MILRIDDTDVERNTEASLNSIFEGLRWLDLGWDEQYRQSERLALHREMAEAIFQKGLAYRDFTPARRPPRPNDPAPRAPGSSTPECARCRREESDRRAAAGEPFALRFRVPRDAARQVRFTDAVYGEQSKSTADIEDFALLRSDGMPTYHLASCADDADSAHQPHHPRPGPPHQHLQARADLRSRRRRRRRSSRTCRCWWRPMAPSSPSAATGRWSASPPIATPAFCRTPSSISCACWAGRPRTIASR